MDVTHEREQVFAVLYIPVVPHVIDFSPLTAIRCFIEFARPWHMVRFYPFQVFIVWFVYTTYINVSKLVISSRLLLTQMLFLGGEQQVVLG